ncbi:hypothetical protein BH23GEM9_BH23GEM9_34450 [soil metagenome]
MLEVRLAAPRRYENLTIFPLVAPGAADLPYELLVDALAAGTLSIGEVGEGTVPTLIAKNAGGRAVLVLDGEQLIGARQNRMTNRSILLAAGATTEIPVYCMEQGRWHFDSSVMAPAPQHSPTKVRRRARETEARHASAGVSFTTDALREAQGDVWNDVSETLHAVGGSSATHSLDAAYAANSQSVDRWLAPFPRDDDQVGLLAFIAGAPLGMDIIGTPRLYERLHERLLRGYIMDALEGVHGARSTAAGTATAQPEPRDAQAYLDTVRSAQRVEAPTVGLGRYHVLGGTVIGGELVEDMRVAHLSAFPAHTTGNRDGTPLPNESPVAPPSRRRRHR